jgi:hypothetical protein
MREKKKETNNLVNLLSELLFQAENSSHSEQIAQVVANSTREDLGQLWELATTHHVILRAFPVLRRVMAEVGKREIEWVENAMATERRRVQRALSFLGPVYNALQEVGHVVVIKSLDHAPDLGSDLDLYSTAPAEDVVAVMRDRFHARTAERSWGDRMANKWNFIVPGLPELVEVHVGRLGQMGEQVDVTKSLVVRAVAQQFGQYNFRVPSAEDRLVISTLQRMYRHFYFRLCDIADTFRLVQSVSIDYGYLESLTRAAGLWDGICSYLMIVSDYVKSYGGNGLRLPPEVTEAAQFGGAKISVRRKFLRIPIFPQAMRLYAKEWTHFLCTGELQNTLRLSLLPGLALAAALTLKITGSDKGVW